MIPLSAPKHDDTTQSQSTDRGWGFTRPLPGLSGSILITHTKKVVYHRLFILAADMQINVKVLPRHLWHFLVHWLLQPWWGMQKQMARCCGLWSVAMLLGRCRAKRSTQSWASLRIVVKLFRICSFPVLELLFDWMVNRFVSSAVCPICWLFYSPCISCDQWDTVKCGLVAVGISDVNKGLCGYTTPLMWQNIRYKTRNSNMTSMTP